MTSINPEAEFGQLKKRIDQIALAVAPDYPGISCCDAMEQLWAIRTAYEGCNAANGDMHILVRLLAERCGMSPEQVVDFWKASRGELR